MDKKRIIFFSLIFLFIFSYNFTLPRDPDFGWHMKYGEDVVLRHKIHLTDTFSYTYRGKSVVDTEWLSEGIFYFIYSKFSFLGLSLFSAFFTTLAFFIPIIVFRGNLTVKFLLTVWSVIGSSVVLLVGPRIQNISLVFFSFLTVFLFKYTQTGRRRYLWPIPPLFLIWANAHPGYSLGIFLLVIYLLIVTAYLFNDLIKSGIKYNLKEIKKFALLSAIFLLSFCLSGVKPKSIGPSGSSLDVIKALVLPVNLASNVSLVGRVRVTIAEWLPPVLVDLPGTLFYLGILFSIAFFSYQFIDKRSLKYIIILLVFIYFSLLSRRNTPFFFLIFLPCMLIFLEKKIIESRFPFLRLLNILTILLMLLWVPARLFKGALDILPSNNNVDVYCRTVKYPCEAINFIQKNKPAGNMFNSYDWGGYLIWQLPEYPVFIDGRVPGQEIYSEFETVNSLNSGWQEILAKYNVKWMIIRPNQTFNFIVKSQDNWQVVYTDEIANILEKL